MSEAWISDRYYDALGDRQGIDERITKFLDQLGLQDETAMVSFRNAPGGAESFERWAMEYRVPGNHMSKQTEARYLKLYEKVWEHQHPETKAQAEVAEVARTKVESSKAKAEQSGAKTTRQGTKAVPKPVQKGPEPVSNQVEKQTSAVPKPAGKATKPVPKPAQKGTKPDPLQSITPSYNHSDKQGEYDSEQVRLSREVTIDDLVTKLSVEVQVGRERSWYRPVTLSANHVLRYDDRDEDLLYLNVSELFNQPGAKRLLSKQISNVLLVRTLVYSQTLLSGIMSKKQWKLFWNAQLVKYLVDHPRAAEKAPDDWSINLKWLKYLSEHYPNQAQETTVLEHLWLVEEALAGVLNALNVEAGELDQDAVKRVSNQLNAMYSSVAKRHWTRLRTSRQHR